MAENIITGIAVALGAAFILGLWRISEKNPAGYARVMPWLGGGVFALMLLGILWNMSSMYTQTILLPVIKEHSIDEAVRIALEGRLPMWLLFVGGAFMVYVGQLPNIHTLLNRGSDGDAKK